jgi:hypothetical protein
MKLLFYNKKTGELLPELEQGRYYIIFADKLYECEFGTSDGNTMGSGEARMINIDFDLMFMRRKD